MQKLLTFFSKKKKTSVYAIFNDQSFNDTLTNDIVSFEQLGPALLPNKATTIPDRILQTNKKNMKKSPQQIVTRPHKEKRTPELPCQNVVNYIKR